MKQFILPRPPDKAGLIRLSGRDFHYLARVRRLRAGDSFKALLPSGEAVLVRVKSLEDSCLTGECCPVTEAAGPGITVHTAPPLPRLLLFQALPKGAKMDLIVRQAAEGGISEIAPFVSEYSIAGIRAGEKPERWRRIVKEARQQSGSPVDTLVREPCTLEELFRYWDTLREGRRALGLFFHQDPLEQGTFHSYLNTRAELVALAIGPEGGFSPEERGRFIGAGFKPLVMGNTVLRTETAALYAAAAVRIILWEVASWTPKPPER